MAGVTGGRQGIVFVERTGEHVSPDHHHEMPSHQLHAPASPASSDSERSYAEIYSDDSYHSDGSEIADTWDPYRERVHCINGGYCFRGGSVVD